jgi:hypothetical protein
LFILLHQHLRAVERHVLEQESAVAGLLESLRQAVAQTAKDVDTIEAHRVELQPPGLPARGALNLSRRSQALRLARRGDSPERIAAELGVPRQEVELLLKVHRIVLAQL